eukprot:1178411-Prorocentrum_minimum.AAC.2
MVYAHDWCFHQVLALLDDDDEDDDDSSSSVSSSKNQDLNLSQDRRLMTRSSALYSGTSSPGGVVTLERQRERERDLPRDSKTSGGQGLRENPLFSFAD